MYTLDSNIIKPVYAPDEHLPWSRGTRPLNHRFGLLRVCQQIYAETASLPWTLSMFSFSERSTYEDLCLDEHDAKKKRDLICFAQIGVDPWDLYGIAKTEDSGYDEEEEEKDTSCQLSAKLSTFTKLERLELLLARTTVEDEDEEVNRRVEHIDDLRKFSFEEVQEAKEKLRPDYAKEKFQCKRHIQRFRGLGGHEKTLEGDNDLLTKEEKPLV